MSATNEKLLSVGNVVKFVLAGNSTFTVVRPARTRKVVRKIGGVPVEVSEDLPPVRYTFKLQRAKGTEADRPWFAKLLTGPNNETDYSIMGTIFPAAGGPRYRHNYAKSTISHEAPSVRCLNWLLDNINRLGSLTVENATADMFRKGEIGDEVADVLDTLGKVEVWHQGTCCRCNRPLTVPASIESGIGPECIKKVGVTL